MKKIDVNKLFQQGSKIQLNDINFDEVNFQNLMVNTQDGSFLQHLQKQPAGVAYYGMLHKQAKQELKRLQKQRDSYLKNKASLSMLTLQKATTGKVTKYEAEDMALMSYKEVFDKYNQQIEELTEQTDILQEYYLAWKQKGFTLNNIVNLVNTGFIKINNK